MKVTQFYQPKSKEKIVFKDDFDESFVTEEDCLSYAIDTNPRSLPKGIWDCILENRNYTSILGLFDIADVTNSMILDKIIEKYCPLSSSIPLIKPQSNEITNSDRHEDYPVSEIAYMAFVEKYSIKSIAALMSLEIEIVRKITDEFKQKLKQSKPQGKREEEIKILEKTQRDEDDIKTYLNKLNNKVISIAEIRSSINATRDDNNKLSWYRIRKTLKEKLRMSYKRASTLNKKTLMHDNSRQYFAGAALQFYANEAGIEMIFIDEASINLRN